MSRYEHGVDANHSMIVNALRQMGVSVVDLSGAPRADKRLRGLPDLLCHDQAGTYLVEIKTPDGRLKPGQVEFADGWPGDVYVIRTIDDAVLMARDRTSRVRQPDPCQARCHLG